MLPMLQKGSTNDVSILRTLGGRIWLPYAGLEAANGIAFVVRAFESHKVGAVFHIHLLLESSHCHTLQIAQGCISVLHTTTASILKGREKILDVRGPAVPGEPGLHTRPRVRAHGPLVLIENSRDFPKVVEENERALLAKQGVPLWVGLQFLDHLPFGSHIIQHCLLHLLRLGSLGFHQKAGRSLRGAAQIESIERQFHQTCQCCVHMIPNHVGLGWVGRSRNHQYLSYRVREIAIIRKHGSVSESAGLLSPEEWKPFDLQSLSHMSPFMVCLTKAE